MAYSITVLAMGGIFFSEGYTKSGQTNYLLDAVKWGTDYFIKCHVSQNVLYGFDTACTIMSRTDAQQSLSFLLQCSQFAKELEYGGC